jgi:L-amino acid N-acyltransferase YncA
VSGMAIREATVADATAIAAIYAHHVLHGTATYDFDPPDGAYWTAKIADILSRDWPFLVADDQGGVMGYAYATQIRDRPGYRFTCEDSIYVDPARTGHGIGTQLLSALIAASRTAGFGQMIAVIGGAEPASVAVHARSGFREVGRLSNVGHKFGRYLDSVYMQRGLGTE